MRKSELKTGVVYAWTRRPGRLLLDGAGKCVFVDLKMVRTVTDTREDRRFAPSQAYETFWGRKNASYLTDVPKYRGYAAVAASEGDDDADLLARAKTTDLVDNFAVDRNHPLIVVSPREVIAPWDEYRRLITEQRELRAADYERQQERSIDAGRKRERVAEILGDLVYPSNQDDRITVSLEWLVTALETLTGQKAT